jgi:hypothetical protein
MYVFLCCPACGASLRVVAEPDTRTERQRWADAEAESLLREAERGDRQDEAGW